MLPRVFYSNAYEIDIGKHVFPMSKYRLTKEKLVKDGTIKPSWIVEPRPAVDEEILLVHTPSWLEKVRDGTMTALDEMRLELPYSHDLSLESYLAVGGTISACEEALERGAGVHIGGGFHHAHCGHGEGFCVFNDIAIAIEVLRKAGKIKRACVVDLDVHQGNGTAAIFAKNPEVFTFSMHQESIYPPKKPPSSLDIGLEDETGDQEYLRLLQENLPTILDSHKPDLVVYQAGADTFKEDQLGGLNVSLLGMAKRDEIVFNEAAKRRIPCALTLGGGYAQHLEDTVTIHATTITLALK